MSGQARQLCLSAFAHHPVPVLIISWPCRQRGAGGRCHALAGWAARAACAPYRRLTGRGCWCSPASAWAGAARQRGCVGAGVACTEGARVGVEVAVLASCMCLDSGHACACHCRPLLVVQVACAGRHAMLWGVTPPTLVVCALPQEHLKHMLWLEVRQASTCICLLCLVSWTAMLCCAEPPAERRPALLARPGSGKDPGPRPFRPDPYLHPHLRASSFSPSACTAGAGGVGGGPRWLCCTLAPLAAAAPAGSRLAPWPVRAQLGLDYRPATAVPAQPYQHAGRQVRQL